MIKLNSDVNIISFFIVPFNINPKNKFFEKKTHKRRRWLEERN
jgi:hypothetical protein